MKGLYHIIWSTYHAFPVWDIRGDWSKLAELYAMFDLNAIGYQPSHELPRQWERRETNPKAIELTSCEQQYVQKNLQGLVVHDRIAGGLEVMACAVSEQHVELLVREEGVQLLQKVARLKSRLATLLHFAFPQKFQGAHTWGKGIWVAEILSHHQQGIALVMEHRF